VQQKLQKGCSVTKAYKSYEAQKARKTSVQKLPRQDLCVGQKAYEQQVLSKLTTRPLWQNSLGLSPFGKAATRRGSMEKASETKTYCLSIAKKT
jgi:hypothetical protein